MTVGVVAAVSGWNNKRKSRGEESERAARLLFPRPPLILGMAMQIIQKWSKCPNLWENCEKLWSWSILSIVLSQIGISPPIGGLQSNYKFKWFCWSLLFRKVYPSYLFCGTVAQVLKTSRRVSNKDKDKLCLCLCLSLCIKACVCGRNSGSSYEQQPLTFSFEPPPTSSLLRWTPEEQSK